MDAFRAGFVYVEDCYAGTLSETEDGYRFAYDADYLSSENPRAVHWLFRCVMSLMTPAHYFLSSTVSFQKGGC